LDWGADAKRASLCFLAVTAYCVFCRVGSKPPLEKRRPIGTSGFVRVVVRIAPLRRSFSEPTNAGAVVQTSTPADFAAFVAQESDRWKTNLEKLGLAGTR
jgi:hypothetical protein